MSKTNQDHIPVARNIRAGTTCLRKQRAALIAYRIWVITLAFVVFGCDRKQSADTTHADQQSSGGQSKTVRPPAVTPARKAAARKVLQRVHTETEKLRREIKGTDFYYRIVRLQCKAGDVEGAVKTREGVNDPYGLCNNTIAEALASQGQIDSAVAQLASVNDQVSRAEGLQVIAAVAAESDTTKLRNLLASDVANAWRISKEGARTAALRDLAVGQAWIGDADAAVETASMIEAPGRRAMTLGQVAYALASRGAFERAVPIVRDIPDRVYRPQSWVLIAKAQAAKGKAKEATESVSAALEAVRAFQNSDMEMDPKMLGDPTEFRKQMISEIVSIFCSLGDLRSAKDLVMECAGKSMETDAWLAFAKGCLGSGKKQEAVDALSRAAKLVSSLSEGRERVRCQIDLARAYKEAGEISRARQTIAEVRPVIDAAANKKEYWAKYAATNAAAVLATIDGLHAVAPLAHSFLDSMERLDFWRAVGAARSSSGPDIGEIDRLYPTEQPSLERLGYLIGTVEALLTVGNNVTD